jgi:hypothetical protein
MPCSRYAAKTATRTDSIGLLNICIWYKMDQIITSRDNFFQKNQYFERLSNNKMTLVYGVSSSKKFCLFEFLYRELTCRNLLDTPDNYRDFSKGRKNLLEVTESSISMNYKKTSMVVRSVLR